ncbi:MAG: PilT protein domain protein [Thermomicrobiales bacterium]|nr:PilT protein domain protein [Thermomicrobiales bacterium]
MTADGPPVPDAAIDDVLRDVTFVDASALVALADRDDASHAAAVAAYQDLVASGFHLFTTDLALASAHEMIAVALGQEVARSWLAHCNILVQRIAPADLEEGRRAIEEGWSAPRATLADTIHLAVLDRLGVTDVFAVDRAFLAMLG